MADTTLYDQPDLYDLVAPPYPELERFYVETARGNGGAVLELGCGTGRLTLPLAAAGLQVTGGDLSGQMLARARKAAAQRGLAAAFVELDMRSFDLASRRFDTVIIAANSIAHLHSAADFSGFFASVARHLAPNGKLAFDVFVPSPAILGREPDERYPLNQGVHPQLGRIVVEETISYDPVSQVSHIDWYWSSATERDFLKTPLQLRQIFPQELPLLLAASGFRLTDRYGDFDRSPLTSTSRRQVCLCAPA